MSDYQTIRLERDGYLATITISREKQLNALNSQVLSELHAAVAELELDAAVRVVVVTGAGDKAFVAGADIAEMVDMDPAQARPFAELGGALGHAIETSAKVYIAAVNGFALGGGCELALCCDFIYASSKARFGQPEVKLGVIPGFGGTQRLPRRVGVAKAKELVLGGGMIDAQEALRIGLADKVVPPEELMAACRAIADQIAANGPLAVAEAKKVIHQGQSMALEHAIALEQRAFAELFITADRAEGMRAFLDKRPANFEGK
ncbi:MAG: enoyl-CoA hydratase/isomerase family protein [Deltaproteobacteria bacterium]|nr:MAG: enoyl-CoA hydratase/isomerase family protein [Deltaproteobacteria bacterium]